MTASATPRYEVYTPGPGPYIEREVNDPVADQIEVGTMVTLSSGKAVRAAADAIRVYVCRSRRYDPVTGKYYVTLDGTGAILEVVYASAAEGGVKIADNQTVLANADPTKWAGVVEKIVSTNVAQIRLRDAASAPYAS
jgi:hypothetical protein